MRLLVKLAPLGSKPYDDDYHYHLQAAVYSLIRQGGLPNLHDKQGCKFFCFSNIFPYGPFTPGIQKNLLISSPEPDVINAVRSSLISVKETNATFRVGASSFQVEGISNPFNIPFDGPIVTLKTATPIIVRIPKEVYVQYGVKLDRNYEFVYWRPPMPTSLFTRQLMNNTAKKVKEFMGLGGPVIGTRLSEENLVPKLNSLELIRSVATPLTVRSVTRQVIGSLWQFSFNVSTPLQKHVLEIALDTGFGERNMLGFGFMNIAENSVHR